MLCMWRVGRLCRRIWTTLEAKYDLAASHCALSLRFSGQSRELRQKAANSPHLPSPLQGVYCVFHCRAALPGTSFAPRQAHVSTAGTPGYGSHTGWARWMTHKSWDCAPPASSKVSSDAASPLQGEASLPKAALCPLEGG